MLNERKLTENEIEQRRIALKGLLKNKRALVKKYGADAEKVMYGIATKQAKKKIEKMNLDKLKEMIQDALTVKEASPFVLAADAAKDSGKKEFEFPKGSGKMHPVTLKKDLPELDERVAKIDEILDEERQYNQEEELRLDLIARRKFDCDFKKCTDEQKAEVLKDKDKVGVKEMDINDPVLMRMRAPKPEPSRGGIDYDEALTLRGMLADLKKQREQLFRDMEQEAEPEGGPIADRYGDELNKIEDRMYKVAKQLRDYDMNEATRQDLGMGSSVSKRRAKAELNKPGNDGSKVYGLDKDGKRVHIKSINDVDKFKKFELDADLKEIVNEAMDGGQLFDYFANKGYVVKERRPDGYPPKEGVEGFQVTDRPDSGRRSDNPQTVIFQYNKDTDQFTISQMNGYKIDQGPAMKAGMREKGMTWVAGIDSYITDGNYNPVDISAEGLKDIVDHVMGGLSREAKAQKDFYGARGRTSGTIDEKIAKIVKEKLTKRKINEGFKVGQKVKYLGHPAEITLVDKDVMDRVYYNVSYDKGNGKTKVSNIYNKDGEIKENMVADKDIAKEIKKLEDENPKGFKKEISRLKVRQAAIDLMKKTKQKK